MTNVREHEGLILGNFFTPLVSILRNRLPSFSVKIKDRPDAIVFTFHPVTSVEVDADQAGTAAAPFEWSIGSSVICFQSRLNLKRHES